MRFENGLPTDLYLNAHTFGAFYTFTAGMFTFVRGKSYTLNNQTAAVIYPLTVNLVEGLHPELFVANGSHGIWGGAGRFEYARTPRLFDATSRGFGWRTWLNLVMVDATAASFAGTDLQWLNFNGRWGNDDELACESYLWYGRFCGVERAPFGPGVYDASGARFNWKEFWLEKPLEKSLEFKPFLELLFVPLLFLLN